jgi:hypothetical protein
MWNTSFFIVFLFPVSFIISYNHAISGECTTINKINDKYRAIESIEQTYINR